MNECGPSRGAAAVGARTPPGGGDTQRIKNPKPTEILNLSRGGAQPYQGKALSIPYGVSMQFGRSAAR